MSTPEDDEQRYSLYRLCTCPECEGVGHGTYPQQIARWEVVYSESAAQSGKCPECRGEGRVRDEVASCDSPEAVGLALVTLAREGEWTDADGKPCAFGLLDREGEKGKKWLILPWPETARTASAAGRLLRSRRQ